MWRDTIGWLPRFGDWRNPMIAKPKACHRERVSMNDAQPEARESRTLAALRDALLPTLISGELRVKDAARFVREVAT